MFTENFGARFTDYGLECDKCHRANDYTVVGLSDSEKGYGKILKCNYCNNTVHQFYFYHKNDAIVQIGNICPTKTRDNPNQGRVYDIEGICPSINCMSDGNLQPMVLVRKDFRYFKARRNMNYDKLVCEARTDEGLRTFKDDAIGTIRTIDSGVIKE